MRFPIRVFFSTPGDISEKGCWVCFYGIWMHTGDTLWDLFCDVVVNFRSDRNMIG